MKYDLIVVGGGPGGLMAAKTAAEDGLKVLLVEQKKDITRITRSCLQVCYLEWVCPDGYLETVKLELSHTGARFLFPGPGFSIDYTGPLKVLNNCIWISPSGYKVHTMKDENFAFYFDKEVFVAGLLAEAEKAGAEVWSGTPGIAAENTKDGVKVRVRSKSGEQTLEARKAIAADGLNSRIVDSLGLNKERKVFIPRFKSLSSDLEGVECDFPGHETSILMFKAREGFGLTPRAGNLKSGPTNFKEVMKNPNYAKYAHWFRNARAVRNYAVSNTVRTPVREPVVGNVVIVGDAGASAETWIQGAVACGYQAVKAIEKELNGEKGYPKYINWWQKAFYHNDPGFFPRVFLNFGLMQTWTDDEIDYVCKFFQGQKLIPTLVLAKNPEQIKDDNPEFYDKLKKGIAHFTKMIEPLLETYPPGSTIFKEPHANLGRWRPYPYVVSQ